MLEQSSLLLGPWHPAAGREAGRVRAVQTAEGAALGCVRQPPIQAPHWVSWLARTRLEVYESPDASLVFALRRGWGWPASWRLLDAEERLVGRLRGRALLDGFSYLLAVVEAPDTRGQGRFLAMHGRELGRYALEGETTRVTFSPELEGNPFARMMLLGAALVQA